MELQKLLASIALSTALVFSSAAAAEQTGQAGPLPGTGDSARITSGNRESNAEYNRLIGISDNAPKQATKRAAKSTPVPATAADIKLGSALRDIQGVPLGTIAGVDADGVIVATAATKIKIPAMAFGKDDQGLLLGITAAKFNELVTQARASN